MEVTALPLDWSGCGCGNYSHGPWRHSSQPGAEEGSASPSPDSGAMEDGAGKQEAAANSAPTGKPLSKAPCKLESYPVLSGVQKRAASLGFTQRRVLR